ncbi:MAG: DUF6513 domain-containing protein [Gammaproteobacteria bacterium]|nr:DUF6513 domain-containing protein [Gammaproteobacteria bacterium]
MSDPMPDTSDQTEHILFLTGKLARPSLLKVLEQMQPGEFTYTVRDLGLNVAALMTMAVIERRLTDTFGADRIVLPGRFRGDLDALAARFGVPFERGPDDLKDLPAFFGREGRKRDLSRYDIRIFGEIVDAPDLSPEAVVEMARVQRADGADVVDLGFLPDTPFPHLKDTIALLKEDGFQVSVDSLDGAQLLDAAQSGADYLLSLKRETLWVADETDATPILIPDTPRQLETLYECMDALIAKGRRFIADPILEPIHCGFSDSLARYHQTRRDYPGAEMMMGIGNLSELTHADSAGVNALLIGVASELRIGHILTTQVSEHCRKAIREIDAARRIMFAAREDSTPPTGFDNRLMMLHERKPFPYDDDEIAAFAAGVTDAGFRIQVSESGIHVYNRDLHKTAADPFEFYPELDVGDDGGHAFYLGVELGRAQIAHLLGKRYNQDEELDWGCAVEKKQEDLTRFKEAGVTLKDSKKKKRGRRGAAKRGDKRDGGAAKRSGDSAKRGGGDGGSASGDGAAAKRGQKPC